jgi:hypothetical protein
MKRLLTIAACAGLMVTGLKATESKSYEELKHTIIYRDICEIIALDDGTIWILAGDHWVQVVLTGHASWCDCNIM